MPMKVVVGSRKENREKNYPLYFTVTQICKIQGYKENQAQGNIAEENTVARTTTAFLNFNDIFRSSNNGVLFTLENYDTSWLGENLHFC